MNTNKLLFGIFLIFPMAWQPCIALTSDQVFSIASKSVVVVRVEDGLGSGVYISPKMIATNCHVVGDRKYVVIEQNRRRVDGVVIDRNDQNDVCLVEVKDSLAGVAPIRGIRSFDSVRVGEPVYAIGNPVGFEATITAGIVSQKRLHKGGKLIQFDASISPGNSGGGLFDADGKLVGLPSFINTENRYSQNLNFAWSVDVFPRNITTPAQKNSDDTPKGVMPHNKAWQNEFDAKNYRSAMNIAEKWISSNNKSSDAYAARGVTKEAIQAGTGINDLKYAIELQENNQRALFFAAKSAKARGDQGEFNLYREMLGKLNKNLANTL